MPGGHQGDLTQLLAQWGQGDRGALDSLMPIVYAELRKIAEGYLRRERSGHTLQPTALVNEAWLRLIRQDQPNFENRKRFFALSAQMMRQILVDYARGVKAGRRGGGVTHLTLGSVAVATASDVDQLLALDRALDELGRCSPRQARIIELRHFGGLNLEEVAELLEVSAATVSREQRAAEAWLSRAISSAEE